MIKARSSKSKLTREQLERRKTLRPHPARARILDFVRANGGPASPSEIARATGSTLGGVAYHVRTLVAAGYLYAAGEQRVRGAVEHFYDVDRDAERDASRRQTASDVLALCGVLTLTSGNGTLPIPVALDEAAVDELVAMVGRLRPRVVKVAVAATRRAGAEGVPRRDRSGTRVGSASRRKG